MKNVGLIGLVVLLLPCVIYAVNGDMGSNKGASGSESNPWLIEDFDDFKAFCNDTSKWENGEYARLECDLDLDPALSDREIYSKAPIAANTRYSGYFDGNYHLINNLAINGSNYCALFGQINYEAIIENLGVTNVAIIAAYNYAAAIAGYNAGHIKQCFSNGTVESNYNVGGLAGYNDGHITNCYSLCSLSGRSTVGNIVGYNGEKVSNCYSAGFVDGVSRVGSVCGFNGNGNVQNCFYYVYGGPLSKFGMALDDQGLLEKVNFIGFDFEGNSSDGTEDIWAIDSSCMPRLSWQKTPGFEPPYILDTINTTLSGYGSISDPFVIFDKTDLLEFRNNTALRIGYYKMTGSIDLNGITYPDAFISQNYFGNFDGNNNTIYNMVIEGDSNLGLFAKFSGNIKDLELKNVNINGTGDYIGALAGEVVDGSVRNCKSSGSVNGRSYVGGLVGYNSGNLISCGSSTNTSGTNSGIGGLVGYNEGDCIKCFSDCTVIGSFSVGGFAGESYGPVSMCFSSGNVSGTYNVGGFCGMSQAGYSIISNCYSLSNVSGEDYIGGFTGYCFGYFKNCYATGLVEGDRFVGGFVPGDEDTLSNIVLLGCFWDTETSNLKESVGGVGLDTISMQYATPYLNSYWDFFDETANGKDDIWFIRPGEYPTLMWQIDTSTQPKGDFFSMPLTVNCGFAYFGNNVGTCGLDLTAYGYKDYSDIWYKFDSNSNTTYDIDLSGSDFDTTLAVFDKDQIEVVFNDDYDGSTQSKVALKATNTTYYIRISGYNNTQGNYKLFINNLNHALADFNNDNVVDIIDFSAVSSSWLDYYTINDLTVIADCWLEGK